MKKAREIPGFFVCPLACRYTVPTPCTCFLPGAYGQDTPAGPELPQKLHFPFCKTTCLFVGLYGQDTPALAELPQ